MIGFLMLMGIVAKNSILLVDFAIEEMRAGKSRLTAILEAGHKRARPIVMTTLTLVVVPAAFTLIDDIERWLAPKFGRVITTEPPKTGVTVQSVPSHPIP
jgi:multidrug efflux pump subunit AcrB